ncbi:MAG: hypothetical protein Q4C88_01535 [Akkermansia sp.]|nr:hypothetical protein [Akkermansia sp.]
MIITTAMLSPFMVAMAPETTVQQPQAPAAIYNWENQGSVDVISKEDSNTFARGSFCPVPFGNGAQAVDDWNLC